MNVLLIYPPVSKPCEPPAGIARLAAALRQHGSACSVLDANLEGLLQLMQQPFTAADTWTRRAARNCRRNLAALRTRETYEHRDRYARAVADSNRLLAVNARACGAQVSLADYHHATLAPVRSADLRCAAEHPEQNPFYAYFKERLPRIIDETQPSLIGFSVNFLSQALTAFAMIGFVRRSLSRARIVLGGGLITSWRRRYCRENPFPGLVDLLIDGPGEEQILAACGVQAQAGEHYRPDYTGQALPGTGESPQDAYLSPVRILPYSASSGCYWSRCEFCPEQAEGSAYIPVAPDMLTRDLHALVSVHRPGLIHFLDNALSPLQLTTLIDHPPGAPWYGFARITQHLLDFDFCAALRRSGCIMLQLGIESGDNRVLESMQKGITVADAARALASLHRAGISAYVYLLFGTPGESYESARCTLDFVARHHEQIGFLNLAIFNMPLVTPVQETAGHKSFYEADLSLYTDFEHVQGWDRKAVRRFLDREFTRHPCVAAIVKRDPPSFTSNHAAFFAGPQHHWREQE
jgi:hypothetical protein